MKYASGAGIYLIPARKFNKSFYSVYKEDIEQFGIFCFMCRKKLKLGDLVDNLYPWHTKHNRCRKCYKEEK